MLSENALKRSRRTARRSRVIQSLVTNAVQSIEYYGTVLLKTYAENGRAVVSVTDTGCGMSEEFVRTFALRLSIGERT